MNGAHKKGFTVVLTVAADGSKLIPHVIFKGKRKLGASCDQPGIIAKVQPKGWMDKTGALEWIRTTFPVHCEQPKLLARNSFRAHLTDDVKYELSRRNVHPAVIPGGLTCVLQPLDTHINKPLKDKIRMA